MTPGDLVNVYNVPTLKREFVGQGVVIRVLDNGNEHDPICDEDGCRIYACTVAFNSEPGQAYKVWASEIVPRSMPPALEVNENE